MKYPIMMMRCCAIILWSLSLFFTSALQAATKDDVYAEARIIILKNRIFLQDQKIQCFHDYKKQDRIQNCIGKIPSQFPEKLSTPQSIRKLLLTVVKPTPEQIKNECGHLSGSFRSNCEASMQGKYFQTVALINQGIDPENLKFENADTNLIKEIKELESKLDRKLNLLGSIQTQDWSAWCNSEWGDSCDGTENFNAPDGYQFCRLNHFKTNITTKYDSAWIDGPKYNLFSEERDIPQERRKIKGLRYKMHSSGGPWHDQFKSWSEIKSAVLQYITLDATLNERKQFGCVILSPVTEPEPVPQKPTPNMKFEISIKSIPDKVPDSKRKYANVHIRAKGTPPASITYTVEALVNVKFAGEVEEKWVWVGTDTWKFKNNPSQTANIEWSWLEAKAWRLKNISQHQGD